MDTLSKTNSSMPELDLLAIAKTTRKSLDRLASFANMRSSSDPLPLLTKTSNKIIALIQLIDSSMLAAQFGYQLASDAMIMCDPEETDWDTDVSLDSLRTISAGGYETSKAVMEGFREVKQEVYKIAASTKDSTFVVLVPPDPSHTDTMKIQLKDIGIGLVANLNLLSEFSWAMTNVAGWWAFVKEDVESENPTLLPSSSPGRSGSGAGEAMSEAAEKCARWSQMKEGFQGYYNVINVAHGRYPELLTSSSLAWKSVASARSAEASSIGHDTRHATLPAVDSPQANKPKGVKMLAGKFGFGKHNEKVKRPEADEKNDKAKNKDELTIARKGTRLSSSSAGTGSSSNSSNSPPHVEGQPTWEKIKSSFSCCSGTLFSEGVGHLGHHGLLAS